MFALLLIATTSRRCHKILRCPPPMKECSEEDRLDIKICGAKKVHTIESQTEENLIPPHRSKLTRIFPRIEEEENGPTGGGIRGSLYEENGRSTNLKCSYNSRGEWQCTGGVDITW